MVAMDGTIRTYEQLTFKHYVALHDCMHGNACTAILSLNLAVCNIELTKINFFRLERISIVITLHRKVHMVRFVPPQIIES